MGLLIAAGISGLFCGCAHASRQSLNSFWNSVTPRQWSAKPPEAPPEPRVSANIPDAEPLSDPEVPHQLPATAPLEEPSRNWNLFVTRPRPTPAVPPGPGAEPDSAAAPDSAAVADDVKPDSPLAKLNPPSLQRLRTALTLGFEGKPDPAAEARPGQDQVRLRVDNLLSRSRSLAEEGELHQASHLAQLARQMAEESQLEFAPDAQRPVDVIAFLAQQQTTPPSAEPEIVKTSHTGQATVPDGPAPDATAPKTPDASPPPALIAANAVMRANQGTFTSDAQPQREPAQVATESSAPEEPLPAEPGVELIARVEPVRQVPRDLAGVAAVRERFRAQETDSARSSGTHSERPAALAAPGPTGKLGKPISMSWTWPSLMETGTRPDASTGPVTAILIGGLGLLALAASVWIVASRRRRSA